MISNEILIGNATAIATVTGPHLGSVNSTDEHVAIDASNGTTATVIDAADIDTAIDTATATLSDECMIVDFFSDLKEGECELMTRNDRYFFNLLMSISITILQNS